MSNEYWLLRQILLPIIGKPGLEDIIITSSTLWERAESTLPEHAEQFNDVFVNFVARGGKIKRVKAITRELADEAMRLAPELEVKMNQEEKRLNALKEESGTLHRAEALLKRSQKASHQERETLSRKSGVLVEKKTLTKAKLEHWAAQVALLRTCVDGSRTLSKLLDLWNAEKHPLRPVGKMDRFFAVRYVGDVWKSDTDADYPLCFVHHECDGVDLSTFRERLRSLYSPVFKDCEVTFLEPRDAIKPSKLDASLPYVKVYEVKRRVNEKGKFHFMWEDPFHKAGFVDPWVTVLEFRVRQEPWKKRMVVTSQRTAELTPLDSSVNDITERTRVIRNEIEGKTEPDEGTARVLQGAIAPQVNAGLMKACALLVDTSGTYNSKMLQRLKDVMWDFVTTVRKGLAFFSTTQDASDVKLHRALCSSFRDLLALVLPSLGAPSKKLFSHESLYEFFSMLHPNSLLPSRVDSPATARHKRVTSIGKNSDLLSSITSNDRPGHRRRPSLTKQNAIARMPKMYITSPRDDERKK